MLRRRFVSFRAESTFDLHISSGSDAEYLPIAIARALQPDTQKDKKIVNIVTQLKEIGAGTNSKHHSQKKRPHFLYLQRLHTNTILDIHFPHYFIISCCQRRLLLNSCCIVRQTSRWYHQVKGVLSGATRRSLYTGA